MALSTQNSLTHEVLSLCETFDKKYSRFLPNSWLNTLKNAPGEKKLVPVDQEAQSLFAFGLKLEQLSNHHFTLNIADELSRIGYDEAYTLQEKQLSLAPKGRYWLEGKNLSMQDRVAFDLGAYGKGYLIDQIARFLQREGQRFFLIDGSGDFWGTTKKDGSSWNIALEHPLDTSLALGTFALRNQGFASSSPSRRKWGAFHHILDGVSGVPVQERLAAFVSAETATLADAFTTVLFVTPENLWTHFDTFSYEWCVVENQAASLRYRHSSSFNGIFFP